MQPGLVSVIMPSYNSVHTLARAIESVKKQDYRPMEISIVSDCSTDHTATFIKNYDFGDIGVIFSENSRNLGIGISRNRAIYASRGEYLAFLDSDDEWTLKNKITLQISFLKQNPDYGFVCTYGYLVHGINQGSVAKFIDDLEFRQIILSYFPAHTYTWLLRRSIFESVGDFWRHRLEDYEYILRTGLKTKCYCLPIVSGKYYNSHDGDHNKNIYSSFFWALFLTIRFGIYYPNFLNSFFRRIYRAGVVFFCLKIKKHLK